MLCPTRCVVLVVLIARLLLVIDEFVRFTPCAAASRAIILAFHCTLREGVEHLIPVLAQYFAIILDRAHV